MGTPDCLQVVCRRRQLPKANEEGSSSTIVMILTMSRLREDSSRCFVRYNPGVGPQPDTFRTDLHHHRRDDQRKPKKKLRPDTADAHWEGWINKQK